MAQTVKNLPAMQETWVWSLSWEDAPGGGHGKLLQYSCLENPHGLRSLAGYSLWGQKESDMTEQLRTQGRKVCSVKVLLGPSSYVLILLWLSPGKINTLLTLLKPTTRPERKDASQMKKLVPEKALEYKVPISPHPCQQSLSVIWS